MIQEINLYQPMFRREKKVFSAATLAQITVVVVLALIAIYAWQAVSTSRLETRLATLRAQQRVAAKKLATLATANAHRKVSPALAAEVAQAEQRLLRQRAALAALERPSQGNTQGFTKPLAALGRAIVPGLWLTHVKLGSGGSEVTLGGRMSEASELPIYLHALGQQAPFSKRVFSVLKIQRDKRAADTLNFDLSTATKKRKGASQ